MSETASLVGDADTNCAIVGGLIGAYVGINNIEKYLLYTVFEFDCTDEKMLITNNTMRPDFLNVGLYCLSVIQKLIDIRVKDSIGITFINDDFCSRNNDNLETFKRGGVV